MKCKNFFPAYKLSSVCAADDLRPFMNYIHFKDGYAYASNSHVLVRIKLADMCNFEEEEIALLNGKAIFRKRFDELLKYEYACVTRDGIKAGHEDGNWEVTYVLKDFVSKGEKVPDFEAVLDGATKVAQEEGIHAIGLKPIFLQDLCRAIGVGDDVIKLRLRRHDAAIVVTLTEQVETAEIKAIIMPMVVEQ